MTSGLLPGLFATPAAVAATPPAATVTHTHATKVGTFSFADMGSAPSGSHTAFAPPHQPMNKTLRHTTAAQVPKTPGAAVVGNPGGAVGFNGLDDYQQTNAGTGAYAGSQFDVTPPDQGLCVGGTDVVEAVNLAMRVYSKAGAPLTPAVPLNQFLGVAPETTAGGAPFGPFLSDPKCYYDPGTSRWFMSLLAFSVDPATGAFGNTGTQYIAVTATSDPTGTWNIYSFATTDDGTAGTPSHPGCPCFGDQPLLGADANGIYITTNEYSISGPAYNGAQIYAMSKAGLETGTNTAVTHLQPGSDPGVTSTLGGVAFSIQPATSPASGYQTAANGTEYFQSALDFGAAPALGTRADRIAVWSLTNTASLDTATPSVSLSAVVLPSEEYTQPPNATQAPGTLVISKRLPLLDANDDRMNQVVFANGQLWSGLNTAVKTPQGPTLAGIAWFVTDPATGASGALSAAMAGQGYLAVNGEDVMYPSIGVTPAGKAAMAFTLVGPDYHPSAAWAPVSTSGVGPIYVAAAGKNAADDFSAVKAFGGSGSIRWGDYSAAVSDPSGTIWMAAEYISGLESTAFANWATYVYNVTPS
ncbi:MAG TPA: hypothetical protein VG184_00455 [Acidimicrobiales bacterium]|nr:hypothetical protein [Acidimicrobiales bacterium]